MCEKGVEKAKGEKWRVSKPPLPALYCALCCALYCAHTYTKILLFVITEKVPYFYSAATTNFITLCFILLSS